MTATVHDLEQARHRRWIAGATRRRTRAALGHWPEGEGRSKTLDRTRPAADPLPFLRSAATQTQREIARGGPMTGRTAGSAPRHLSAEMKAWWRQVASEYVLEAHHLLLLTQACEAHDRATQARRQVDADGPVTADRFGQLRAHPAVQIERDSRAAFARLVRQLDLEGEGDALYRRNT